MKRTFDLVFSSFERIIVWFMRPKLLIQNVGNLESKWSIPPIGVKKGKITIFGIRRGIGESNYL